MQYRTFSIVLSALILLSSCQTTNSASKGSDSTLKEVRDEYPGSSHMKAEGMGQSEGEAKLSAKGELSAIFESRVSSEIIRRVRSVVDASGEEKVSSDDEQNVKVFSSVEIKGIEIARTWFDRDQGVYHALAVLNKSNARKEWQAKIDNIDAEVGALLAPPDTRQSSFSRLRSLKKAKNLWIEKEVFVSRLRVLGASNASKADYDIRAILKEASGISSTLLLSVSISGGEEGNLLSESIYEGLTAEGYVITDDVEKANVKIRGEVRVFPLDLKNEGWVFARAAASISIIDLDTGLTVGEVLENKRASHLTYKEAAHKAVKGVSRLITEKTIEYFNSVQ